MSIPAHASMGRMTSSLLSWTDTATESGPPEACLLGRHLNGARFISACARGESNGRPMRRFMVVMVFLKLEFALICAVSPMERDSLNPTIDLWYSIV